MSDPIEQGAERPVVVVVGDPINGYSFHGPAVPNSPEIEAFTETPPICNETWWYADLEPIPGVSSVERGPSLSPRTVTEWADVVADFTRWKLSPWQAQNLVRLAAAAVDSGEIGARGIHSELHSFSDPDEIEETARRAWAAIRYLGDGEGS